MKSFVLAATFITGTLAGALGVPANVQWLSLQTKSNTQSLNGLFLSAKNGKVGLFDGDKTNANKAAKVFTTQYATAATVSLHIADDSHQIALAGSNGLLELVDVINPTAQSIPRGQAMEWSTFVIGKDGSISIKDGAEIPTRRWVTFENTDGSFGVALYDGVTVPQARALSNITLTAVRAS